MDRWRSGLDGFVRTEDVSHVEIASVNFDQWTLTVALRAYAKADQSVLGMIHVVFDQVEGFRLLDEGAMLRFPWKRLSDDGAFVHRIPEGGWLDLERDAGNILPAAGAAEYLIVTQNECVSVIAYAEPAYEWVKSGAANTWTAV